MKKKLLSMLALVMTVMTASAIDAPSYNLTVGTNDHGSVKFTVGGNDATTANEGDVVTVTITPDKNWAVGTPSGKWFAGTVNAPRRTADIDLLQDFELTPVEGSENAFTFTMKRANVKISTTYKKMLTHEDIGISGIDDLTYNAQAQTPAVTVTDGEYTLVPGTDYTIEYSDNTNAGKATVTLKGTGDNYAGEWVMNFTILPAKLTSMTLDKTEFMYNVFKPQPQTANVTEVKAGELVVPAEQYDVEGNTQTEVGPYTVTVTGKTNFTGSVTADFEIKDTEVPGDAEKTETGEEVDDVKMTISVVDATQQTLSIDKINETTPSSEGITVEIPAVINGWSVTSITAGATDGLNNVTDIVMPNTEKPILVEAGAFPGTATIHTTLALLDDYALMIGLKNNYEATKIVCTVTPANKYWTLGTGCDVIIPAGIDVYTVQVKNTAEVATEIVPEDLLKNGNERIIKANNGVLLLGEAGQSYDLVAYSGRIASGMPIATTDNKDYGHKNCLEPVIEKKHYESGHYFVLQDNEFHAILAEGDEVKVPAGKAVLHLGNDQAGANARVLKIDAETTGMSKNLTPALSQGEGAWYDLNGRKLQAAPTKKGVYILNGKKVVVK